MARRERWRMIPGYGDAYLISDLGRVLSLKRSKPHFMLIQVDEKGYPEVQLSNENRVRYQYVHRLVAEAFHGPCPEGQECRHLNGDRADNRAENLQWGTPSENSMDCVQHGTHQWASKTHCHRGHPFDADNTYRRPSRPSRRDCRACRHERRQALLLATAAAEREVAA